MSDDPFDDVIDESEAFGDVRVPLIDNDGGVYPQIENRIRQGRYKDELLDLMEKFTKANNITDDEFYTIMEGRKARLDQANQYAKQVGNPPTTGRTNFGGSWSPTPGSTVNLRTMAEWAADSDHENMPITITAGVVTPLKVNGATALRPYMVVNWGCFNTFPNVEVDIGRGVQLTVCGSSCSIDIGLDALSAADSTNAAQLFAFIGFKPMVRTSPLIRTKYIDSLAQNATSTVQIPPFAVGLLPIQMADVATPGKVQLDFYDSSTTIVYSLTINNGTQVSPIPLTSDVVQVIVTNKTATTQNIRLPFQLAI